MARWQFCNILQVADGAHRLWQFDAKGGGFALNREHHAAPGESLPFNVIAKTWRSLWQPKLNVAWLPPENVFLRVIELPRSGFGETLAMVELQLEKLSPIPVTQIVWTIHVLPRRSEAAGDTVDSDEPKPDDLQTVVVVIAARHAVEEFLGKLEDRGYLADRLEAPMLDQLEATPAAGDGLSRQSDPAADAWIYPSAFHGQNAALVAWWCGGALRSLSVIILPPGGDPAKGLKEQLAQLTWAGELEGWLAAPPSWHLVAEGAVATEWENALRVGLGEPVQVVPPLPLEELAARTACRSVEILKGGTHAALLPREFSVRYHQQFFDRLWLRGLVATGVLYAVGVVVYFCATTALGYKTRAVEQQAVQLGDSYTNVLQLKARYAVLAERQQLKYAALDCWKIVAEQLPAGLSLQRSSFADGQKLTLNGVCSPDQIGLISDQGKFYDAVRKAKLDGQDLFEPAALEPLIWNQKGNMVNWHFTLQLKHTEAAP